MLNNLTLVRPRDEHLHVTIPAEVKQKVRAYAEANGISLAAAVTLMLVFFFEADFGKSKESSHKVEA